MKNVMKKVLKLIGIAIVGLIALGIIIVATNKSPEQKAAEIKQSKQEMAGVPAITAANIAAAYNENTVAADQQFKGKKFKVRGTVNDINTDFMGDPYITLRGGVNEFMEPQFGFDRSEAAQLINVKKGSTVTMICVGKGDIAKTPMSGSCLLL